MCDFCKKYKKTQLAPHTVQTMPSTGSTNAENAIPLPHGKASCCHYHSIRICCVAVIGGVHEKIPPVTLIKEMLHKVRLPALYSVSLNILSYILSPFCALVNSISKVCGNSTRNIDSRTHRTGGMLSGSSKKIQLFSKRACNVM